mmetsp:Transcript_95684/g.274776  ORF Transcript_95684/g.274776 Transcript_95684/m.274776 type:complete len:209 (-) Transcript_95684:231-857(-)
MAESFQFVIHLLMTTYQIDPKTKLKRWFMLLNPRRDRHHGCAQLLGVRGRRLHELQEALDFIQATVKDTLKDQVARNHLEPNDSKWCHHEKPELEIDGPVIGEQQNHNQQKRVGHQHGCRRNLETSDKLCLELIPSKGMSFKFFIVAQSKQHHVERLVLVQPSGEEQGEENWQEYYSSQQSQLAWQMDSHLDAGPRIHVPIGQVDRNH